MIVCHMVVGPGEASRYLQPVLERASWAVDSINVVLDASAGLAEEAVCDEWADHVSRSSLTWTDHEGNFRSAAWETLREYQLTENDYILALDADELVMDPGIVPSVTRGQNKRLGFRFHEMWSMTHYRTDRLWKPYVAYILFPYQPMSSFKNAAMACGREPLYVNNYVRLEEPIGDILHYGYAKDKDRFAKHERYTSLDGGKFHNAEHIRSIMYPPSLERWTKGGEL